MAVLKAANFTTLPSEIIPKKEEQVSIEPRVLSDTLNEINK